MNIRRMTVSLAFIFCAMQIGCGDESNHDILSPELVVAESAPLGIASLTADTSIEASLQQSVADARRFDVSYIEEEKSYILVEHYHPKTLTPPQGNPNGFEGTRQAPEAAPKRKKKAQRPWYFPRRDTDKSNHADTLAHIAKTSTEYFASTYEDAPPQITTCLLYTSPSPRDY